MEKYFNKCYFNGEYISINDANINITSLTFCYAISVFEGVRIYKQNDLSMRPFMLKKHIDRLINSAQLLSIPYGQIDSIPDVINELIQLNNINEDSYVRISLCLSTSGAISTYPENSCLSVTVKPMGRKKWLNENLFMKVKISHYIKPSSLVFPAKIKSISNYAVSRLELNLIKKEGFDMLLYLNQEGHITEAPTSIIMFIKENKLITPPISDNILESVTRDVIMSISLKIGINVEERSIHFSELVSFEEAFLCGTGLEIAPISKIDNFNFKLENQITQKIIKEYSDLVRN